MVGQKGVICKHSPMNHASFKLQSVILVNILKNSFHVFRKFPHFIDSVLYIEFDSDNNLEKKRKEEKKKTTSKYHVKNIQKL